MQRAQRLRTPVLIVGGGPVGLYASALLSRHGVPSLLVERARDPPSHPRAHLINTRSMELLRELGVEEQVRAQTPPMDEWRHFRYCTTLLGDQIAAQDHMADEAWPGLQAASPTEMTHLSQPKLASILRADAHRRAADSGATFHFGYECVKLEQDGTGVRAELRRVAAQTENAAAEPETVVVEADDMLACDGARSAVRRWLGLPLMGPPPLQHFKSVHFQAPTLYERLRDTPAMLYFTFNSHAVAVFVAHNMQQGEWVAQLPYFPHLEADGEALDEAGCAAAIASCIGAHDVPFAVKSVGPWAMRALVAQRLSVQRVHLLGDAAHQFPPAGAFGANTGLQDAHNLCWKLAAVHNGGGGGSGSGGKGHATRALLRSYDAERRPVAVANAELSVHNYHRGLRVADALGLPAAVPHAAETLAKLVVNPVAALLPAAVQRALPGTGETLRMGRRVLIDVAGHAAPHALGRARLQRAAEVVASGAALPLLFARHELGFVYGGDGAATVPGGQPSGEEAGSRRQRYDVEDETLRPSSEAGARLPHHWLTDAQGQRRLSSHDLLQPEVGAAESSSVAHALTLLVDDAGAAHWATALQLLDGEVGAEGGSSAWPLRLVSVAPSPSGDAERAPPPGVAMHALDPCGGWATKRQAEQCGALLVRPDGHVAWRCQSLAGDGLEEPAEAARRLDAVMRTVLGHGQSTAKV